MNYVVGSGPAGISCATALLSRGFEVCMLDAGIELLTNRLPSRQLPVRLLGFGVTQFDGSGRSQQQLFDRPGQKRSQELDSVADQITARFGKRAIRRGAALPPGDV